MTHTSSPAALIVFLRKMEVHPWFVTLVDGLDSGRVMEFADANLPPGLGGDAEDVDAALYRRGYGTRVTIEYVAGGATTRVVAWSKPLVQPRIDAQMVRLHELHYQIVDLTNAVLVPLPGMSDAQRTRARERLELGKAAIAVARRTLEALGVDCSVNGLY
jgi:hypothetical protein